MCACTLRTQIYPSTPLCTLSQFPILLFATNSTNHHQLCPLFVCMLSTLVSFGSFESPFSWNFAPIRVFSDINRLMFISMWQKMQILKEAFIHSNGLHSVRYTHHKSQCNVKTTPNGDPCNLFHHRWHWMQQQIICNVAEKQIANRE